MKRSLTLVLACAVAACDAPSNTTSPAHAGHSSPHLKVGLNSVTEPQIDALRKKTASFKDLSAAAAAGWGTKITDCFSDPQQGGMGYHYGNPALIDGTVEALEPELLLYEPQKDGTLRFVAVEYVVPYGAWTDPNPPQLYGVDFHRNDTFGLWVLHVWHVRSNRSGIFTDWNPKVSCKYAS